MKIKLATAKQYRRRDGLYAVAVTRDWQSQVAALDRQLRRKLIAEAKRQGFGGKAGESAVFQTHGIGPADYVALLGGAGEKDPGAWARLAHVFAGRAGDLKVSSAALALPASDILPEAVEQIGETLLLGCYRFDQLKTSKRPGKQLETVTLLVDTLAPPLQTMLRSAETMATATTYARDLINQPAAVVTPLFLAAEARRIAQENDLSVRVFDVDSMRELGMGALLGVAQGSSQPPSFIELVHRPSTTPRRTIAIAGKGITFDSGGLSLKTASGMESMKRDMAGGADVLAVMSVARTFAPDLEVRGYVAASENMPGHAAFKPGDVVRAFNRKTIEVLNTDAEGRLVLADALSFAAAEKPDVMIDLATLTGAVRTALGTRYAAIMGTDAELVRALIAAGSRCGELLWELPLVSDYRSDLDSPVADLKNIGDGAAGTIVGGLFLKEFVGRIPWAHIDFSSTVITSKAYPGQPRGATGYGVRLLLHYLRSL